MGSKPAAQPRTPPRAAATTRLRARANKAVARLYRLTTRPPDSEAPVEVEPGLAFPRFVVEWSEQGPVEAVAFLERLPAPLELRDRRVLAVGRGAGDLGIEVAKRGAARVAVLDMTSRRMMLSQRRAAAELPGSPIEFRAFDEGPDSLQDDRFDVVLAADALRRAGGRMPVEEFVATLADRVGSGGVLGFGFRGPWRSPYGGATDSRLPWAHLIFPESVIFDEFRRVRPGNRAETFSDLGIGRVTVARFRAAMAATGLRCTGFATNVAPGRTAAALRVVSRIRPLREYLTLNVYGVWRRA